MNKHFEAIKSRLTSMTESFGGKPQYIQNGQTLIRFPSREDAQRCLAVLNGKDVYGNKINVRLFGENSAQNQTDNRSRSQLNLAKNSTKSVSRSNLTQNNQFGGPAADDCKSTLKGLFTRKDDDFKEVVKNLVNRWNDMTVKPDLICDVQRSLKYGKGDGKHTLFIIAANATACRALVDGAKRHLKPSDGLQWKEYVPNSKLTKETTDNLSVIRGLHSGRGENVTELVRKLVRDWNDSEIKPEFIASVERDRKFSGKDGKVMLFVKATSPMTSRELVVGAKKYLKDGIKWSHNKPKLIKENSGTGGPSAQNSGSNPSGRAKRAFRRENDPTITSVIRGLITKSGENVTQTVRKIIYVWNDPQIKANFVKHVERDRKFHDKDGDVLLFVTASSPEASQALVAAAAQHWHSPDGLKWAHYQPKGTQNKDTDLESNVSDFDQISSQFSSIQDLSICSSLQSLDDIPVNDEYKSVILGFDSKVEDNLFESVREMVINWNDEAVQPNYISSVERFPPGIPEVDGKTPLLVTATSPQTCEALISGAEKHLSQTQGIIWTHFNSGKVLAKNYPIVRPQEERPKIESLQKESPQKGGPQQMTSSTSALEHVLFSKPGNISATSVPVALPRKVVPKPLNSPEVEGIVSVETKVKPQREKSPSFFKNLVNRFEDMLQPSGSKSSPKSSPEPTAPHSSKKSQLTPEPNLIMKPAIPFNHFIGNRMKAGLMIAVSARLNTDANTFTFDFYAKNDIAFHFDARLKQSVVVRNSRLNGIWGIEERMIPTFPFSVGQDFDLIIRIESNQFLVSVKGNKFCEFKHRMDINSIKGLSITGDLNIYWLRFADSLI